MWIESYFDVWLDDCCTLPLFSLRHSLILQFGTIWHETCTVCCYKALSGVFSCYTVFLIRFVHFVNVFHLMFWQSPFICPYSQPLQVSPSGCVLKTSVTPPSRWSGVPLRGSAQLNSRVIVLSTARRAVSAGATCLHAFDKKFSYEQLAQNK